MQKMVHDKLTVKELMSGELVYLPPVIKLADLASILRSTTHGGFPVSLDATAGHYFEGPVDLDGLVTRIQLLRMCQNRIGLIRKVLRFDLNDDIGYFKSTNCCKLEVSAKYLIFKACLLIHG